MCMKKQTLVRDAAVMLLTLLAAYAMVMLTQAVMGRIEGVAMLMLLCWRYLSLPCIQKAMRGAWRLRSSACWR